MTADKHQSLAQWEEFLAKNPKIEFVWLQYVSYFTRALIRMIPVAKFTEMIKTSTNAPAPTAAWFLCPGDRLAEGTSPCGTFLLQPDISSAYCQAGSDGTRAVVQSNCLNTDLTPLEECPRSRLQILHDTLVAREGFSVLVGFEIEVVFMKEDAAGNYTPISYKHTYAEVTSEDYGHLNFIEDIVRALLGVGVVLEHFHAEASPGQWEFVLPPASPINAADMLLKARETITNIALEHGIRATLYPRIWEDCVGTGAHAHISVNDMGHHGSRPELPESFFSGLIQHMPAIMPCILPHDISYARVQAGIWSGGEYACWGWENKEVVLRRVATNRFELKLMDGLANPYLALASILAAGLVGLAKGLPLRAGHCRIDPARMDHEERSALGVDIKLPNTLDASLTALEADQEVVTYLTNKLVSSYVTVKRTEMGYLRTLSDDKRRQWLMSRY
ncbi:hypothetical protein H072_5962 [Dactylellina haptotyla CBS 200.50]|uniref:GS catalytic domain-containing protein n=1 Tax=Dactylellina haptotyla (strain CBS 200.50) TaxID=1284197 RepID=S8BXW5_DACHA|nr:hypothetical protein H072_5962 [Dactylellina haptotyla CBS 200.50]